MTQSGTKRKRYYGWTIVIVMAAVMFAGGTETNPVLGLFQSPMTEEFGWTRTMYTAPMTIGTVLGGFLALLVGPAMDRYGGRWIMSGAIALLGATFLLMGSVQEYWHHFALQMLGRMVVTSTFFLAVGVIVPKWFVTMRGRAVAFASLGQRFGQLVVPVMAERIVHLGSWRLAWASIGGLVLTVALMPSLLFLRRRPEDYGMLPDGRLPAGDTTVAEAPTPSSGDAEDDEVTMSARAVLRTPAFYLVSVALALHNFVVSAVHFHWFSYMTDAGISSGAVITSIALGPLVGMPISIAAGFAAERYPVRYVLVVSYGMVGFNILLLMSVDSASMAYLFGFLMGVAMGASSISNAIVWANYFGRATVGTVRGIVAPAQMVLNALGPLTASVSFDALGSYTFIFALSSALMGVAALSMIAAVPPRRASEHAARLADPDRGP